MVTLIFFFYFKWIGNTYKNKCACNAYHIQPPSHPASPIQGGGGPVIVL
jgi:hypothetical protein